ncbi:unnamed protein product [Prorocentrum cordatum]|uniref:Uncharacterized protein n=1 Tax=Prorocentrum cordatum TaxID=2364126 RepID=A0ABN9QHL8_9DINO|nr:unnamed protein product [Polarella glacialis]
MKRHAGQSDSVAAAMEAGRVRAGSGGNVNVSTMPTIQPYQASGVGGFSPHSGGNDKARRDRDSWQQTVSIGCAIWVVGWFAGYGVMWPLGVAAQLLSWFLSFTPFGSVLSWWSSGLPAPEVFPAATELHLATNKVARYMESYAQNYGDAALIFAAHDGYAQVVTGLLASKELGYSELVDAADESGHTALLYAAGRGFTQVSAALLRGGAEPDAPKQGKEGHGLTALMQAAGSGYREIVTLLLAANATVDLQDEFGNSALMYAAHGGQLGCIQELLKQGAMRDLTNRRGDTALSLATAKGPQAVVDALQRGARPVLESAVRRSGRDAASSELWKEFQCLCFVAHHLALWALHGSTHFFGVYA